jgi:hypothetical protein
MKDNNWRAHFLLKFGTKENVEKLKQGKIFFGTRKLYNEKAKEGNENIGDFFEGVYPSKGCFVRIIDPESKVLLAEAKGTLIQSDIRVDKIPFFCCTYISDDNINGENKIVYNEEMKEGYMNEKEWEYVLVIRPLEFIKRINLALPDINIVSKPIIYDNFDHVTVDRDRAMNEDIKNVLLWKDEKYSFQKEFRIILENKEIGKADSLLLEIGDISDITYMFKKEEWFKKNLTVKIEEKV